MQKMSEFDSKAAEWDLNPMHWDRSAAIARHIAEMIPLDNTMKALEYGAGTGITSFLLRERLNEITLMDNSREMVNVMRQKIADSGVKNMKVLHYDLEKSDYPESTFDLIMTQMVLHHVDDVEAVISRFGKILNPGGYIAIADLCEEDGSFHGEGFSGHKGFDPAVLSGMLQTIGIKDTSCKNCFVIDRKVGTGETRKYNVFLIAGRKTI